MMKSGIIEEMVEDSLASALDDDALEEEADEEVEKVMYEITQVQLQNNWFKWKQYHVAMYSCRVNLVRLPQPLPTRCLVQPGQKRARQPLVAALLRGVWP
jgi:hypothetical protein